MKHYSEMPKEYFDFKKGGGGGGLGWGVRQFREFRLSPMLLELIMVIQMEWELLW